MKLIDMVKNVVSSLKPSQNKEVEEYTNSVVDHRFPRVTTNDEKWHIDNGLRITVHTLHDGFRTGSMYSVDHARYLAAELNKACDRIEQEHISPEQIESIYTRYGGDMTNCAHSIARQAVANYVEQQAKKLPVLPDLAVMWLYIGAWEEAEPPALDKCGAVNEIVLHMLRVYGQECAAHAFEKAKTIARHGLGAMTTERAALEAIAKL